jgi:hypothetical protein
MFSTIDFSTNSNTNTTSNSNTPSSPSSTPSNSAARSVNWTPSEVILLIEIYKRHFSALERTSTPLEKQEILNDLVKAFNIENTRAGRQPRLEKAITRKWDTLCSDYRKEFRERSQTGQETPQANPVYDELNKLLHGLATTNPPYRYTSHVGYLVDNRVNGLTTENATSSTPAPAPPAPPAPVSVSVPPPGPSLSLAVSGISRSRPVPTSFFESSRPTSRRRTEEELPGYSSPSPPPPPPNHVSSPVPEHAETQQQQRSTRTQQRNEAVYDRVLDRVLDRQSRERQEEASVLREERQAHADRFDAYFQGLKESQDRLNQSIQEGNEILRTNSQNIEQLVRLLVQRYNNDNSNE